MVLLYNTYCICARNLIENMQSAEISKFLVYAHIKRYWMVLYMTFIINKCCTQ
jgi:hypothetical protein